MADIFAQVFSIESLFTLMMLILLQAVLGFDNLLYIAIESNKVGDPKQAKAVRKWGILLAMVFRIVLLVVIVMAFGALAKPLFSIHLEKFFEGEFTLQSLVTLLGGAFIIYTAVKEISHLLTVDHIEHEAGAHQISFKKAIVLIVLMNLVFSFDSILSAMAIASIDTANIVNAAGAVLGQYQGTVVECKAALIAEPVASAVGCVKEVSYNVPIMAIAIILSGLAMLILADYVTNWLKKNRMYEVMGLFILFLVGVLLVTEGAHLAHMKIFGFTIDAMSKSSFYLVIFVLILTDVISIKYQKRLWAQREQELRGTFEPPTEHV